MEPNIGYYIILSLLYSFFYQLYSYYSYSVFILPYTHTLLFSLHFLNFSFTCFIYSDFLASLCIPFTCFIYSDFLASLCIPFTCFLYSDFLASLCIPFTCFLCSDFLASLSFPCFCILTNLSVLPQPSFSLFFLSVLSHSLLQYY